MKMPEKHDLLAAILAAKEQGQNGATLVFAMAYLAAVAIMAVRLQNSNRRNDVRHYRSVHSGFPRLRHR